jgi:pyruvate formate lyase activating enzyme
MREAMLYHAIEGERVVCDLCAHRCRIRPGDAGICGVRVNQGGTLYTRVYDQVVALEVDPIEKKPFFHFLPGSWALSLATVGCNLQCLHCQNFYLSQMPRAKQGMTKGARVTPSEIVQSAKAHCCRSIAYTYTEPTVFFELAYDTARLAHAAGLKNLFVTNGYLTREAVLMVRPYLDAANIDLKGFDTGRYRRLCGARLEPVMSTIWLMHELGIWVEVTTLVIPGHNDSDEELSAIARFLASISPAIPWHVTAFFPAYKMVDREPTPVETLHRAYMIGRTAGLRYVYCGNVPGDPYESTACHRCQAPLIERAGLTMLANWVVRGRCPQCATAVDGVQLSNNQSN